MHMEQIPPHQVVAVWPKVEPFLADAFAYSAGEYSLEQLRAYLTDGRQFLLAFVEDGVAHGAMTICPESHPNASVAFVTAIGGCSLMTPALIDGFFAWCKAQGFTRVQGATHRSAARLFERIGFQEIYRIVEYRL